jgi:membrane fusion protein, heavy metal efflux system
MKSQNECGSVVQDGPVAGVITDQQITESSGVQALTPPNPFTISDLSRVWIVCDVYENNMAQLHIGEYADIRLAAYPDRVFKGRLSNQTAERRAQVPATAILHLHDRDWVFAPVNANHFRRLEVVPGDLLPGNMREILSGLQAGDRVVANTLVLQTTVEQ